MRPGLKPKGNVQIKWSVHFAYSIGLIVADGCLSKDGRHIAFTSIDIDQLETFKKCLGIHTKTSIKYSGGGTFAYNTQFGDVLFYKFLLKIGLTPAKSKTLGKIKIPKKYFIDFFRGYFDGDGCSFSYQDKVFKNSFRFYISFTSASQKYIMWFREEVEKVFGVHGHFSRNKKFNYIQLRYAKKEAVIISKKMYYARNLPYLMRKKAKLDTALKEICRGGEIGRRATFRS